MIIQAENLLDTIAQYTYLTQSESLGTTTLHIKTANGFNASWGVQLGKTGEEQSEIKILGTAVPSGTTLTLATATVNDHPTDTPVYAIKFDKIIFKVSTSGTSGTATAITNGTVNITPDSQYTNFDHTTGASTYAYKTAYYNSILTTSSSDSDWIIPAGYDFYSLAKMRQRVKDKLKDANFIGTDDVIDDWINEWMEQMTNAAIDVNEDYCIGTVDVAYSGTAELGTITATDFKQLRRAWYTEDGSTWYTARKMDMNNFDPNTVFNSTYPYFFMQGDNVLGRRPYDASGTMRLSYYKLNTVLTNETDNLPYSMRGYTKSFVDYALSQAYLKDNKPDVAQIYEGKAYSARDNFIKELTPRHKTGADYVNIVETIGEMTDQWW